MFTTRSPGRISETSSPTSTTLPANSWPMIVPYSKPGTWPWSGPRSAPQIAARSTRTIASVVREQERDPRRPRAGRRSGPRRTTAFMPAARSRRGSRRGRRRRSGSRPTAARTGSARKRAPLSPRARAYIARASSTSTHEHDVGPRRVLGRGHRHAGPVLGRMALLGERQPRPGEHERRVGRVVVHRLDLEARAGRGRRRATASKSETARIAPARDRELAISCGTCPRRRRASAP